MTQAGMKQFDSEPSIIEVKGLAVDFHQGEEVFHAVKSMSFNLRKGETLAIVGESGSGKSVTANSIMRLLPERNSSHPSGEILFNNTDLISLTETEMRGIRGNRIGMIFQEPMTSLNPLHNIEKQISESLLQHKGLSKPAARARTLELLNLVGIPDPETRLGYYPHELSGGQKQRVMIAMALANEPDVLIADEPTTALDVTIQKQVLELLQDLQTKLGMAIILITHDLTIVRKYADNILVMHKGVLIEQGSCDDIFHAPKEAYTHELVHANPEGSPTPVSESADKVVEANKVNVRFPTKTSVFGKVLSYFHAVKDLSIEVRKGETLGIVGESGSGKTTFALALLKLNNFEGSVKLNGKSVDHLDQKAFRPLRKRFQIVFQDPYGSLSPRMSIGQIIEEGLQIHQYGSPQEREQAVIDVLEEVELNPEWRHRYPHEFSGGQRQRIAIARALVLKPDLIVLDEPTSALDRTVQQQVIDLLRRLQKKYNIAYIFISHDLAVVKAMSHHVIVMKEGQVVESASCKDLFESPKAIYTQNLLEAAYFYS